MLITVVMFLPNGILGGLAYLAERVAALMPGKAQRASLQKDEMVNRQLTAIFNELMPHGGLQERTLNVTYFLDQYGPRFIDWIYRAIDLNDNGHRVVYL